MPASNQSKKKSKKSYVAPKLIRYGSVKKITNLAKRRRVSDGGSRRS